MAESQPLTTDEQFHELDPITGLPIITLEELEALQLPTKRSDYKDHQGEVDTFIHKGVQLKIKGREIISVSAYTKLALLYPDKFTPPESFRPKIVTPVYKKIIEFHVGKVYSMFNKILSGNSGIDGDADELIPWLSLFLVYGEHFIPYLEQYNEDIDKSVSVNNDIDIEKFRMSAFPREIKIDAYDIRATCHVLLISMLKTFHSDRDIGTRQKTQYLSNRKSTVYASMNTREGTLLIKDNFLDKYASCMNLLPSLKKILFLFTYENQDKFPEIGTALTLMHESAMTGITSMHQFLNGEPVTFAHVDKLVLSDAKRFIPAIAQLREELKVFWPFYQFVKPYDTTLQASNFKYLAAAAISWKKKYSDSSFSQVQSGNIPGVPQSIERDAKIKHPYASRKQALLGAG